MAQHRRGGGDGGHSSNGGGQNHGQAMPRASQPPAARPAPAPAPAPAQAPAQRADNGGRRDTAQPRVQGNAVPRSYPGVNGGASRNDAYRNGGGSRSYGNGGSRYYGSSGNRYYGNGGRYYGNYGSRNYSYRGYGYRGPVHFYRPYYSFRPRFSLGFGLWVGYPVPYAYSYYDPFYYGPSYSYPYPATVYPSNPYPSNPYPEQYPSNPYPSYPPSTDYPQSSQNYPQSSQNYPQTVPDPNSIGVQPGQANLGGLSFDITPTDAQVLVDGNLVGTVDQFSPSSQPLGLSAGRHRVEVEAQGYRTISFDVDIISGQVVPYQGAMERR